MSPTTVPQKPLKIIFYPCRGDVTAGDFQSGSGILRANAPNCPQPTCPKSSKFSENQYFIYPVSRSAAPIVGANVWMYDVQRLGSIFVHPLLAPYPIFLLFFSPLVHFFQGLLRCTRQDLIGVYQTSHQFGCLEEPICQQYQISGTLC